MQLSVAESASQSLKLASFMAFGVLKDKYLGEHVRGFFVTFVSVLYETSSAGSWNSTPQRKDRGLCEGSFRPETCQKVEQAKTGEFSICLPINSQVDIILIPQPSDDPKVTMHCIPAVSYYF